MTDASDLRPLSELEAALIKRVIELSPSADSSIAIAQIEYAQHAGPACDGVDECFDLEISDSAPLLKLPPSGPAFGTIVWQGAEPIGFADIWAAKGKLSYFHYSWVTDEVPTELPQVDQLSNEKPRSTPAAWLRRRIRR